ncbi:MAG: hypothetical protein HY231_25870 [Acidobacteria bacterium]|nr:hypothetical protein [Acidobacteriota bacterium]
MMRVNTKIGAAILSLAILFAAVSSASAQSFGGSMSTKNKAKWIGGGAAAGAVIGGLLGGKKGAVIGGLLGAGAGTATVYVKGRREQERYGRYEGRYYGNERYDQRDERYDRYNRYNGNNRYNSNSRFGGNSRCRR